MDLKTKYMGLTLEHPVVPSASPLSGSLDRIKMLEDAGAPAIVMYSLFEEQIAHVERMLDHYLGYGSESFSEALTYFPDLNNYNVGPGDYLELIRKARESVSIPIIGSLNGITSGGWVEYARLIEQAGAQGIELNVYYIPTDPKISSSTVENMYIDIMTDVKSSVSIPVAMKLSPYFSATANMAYRLSEEGASALVLFNRFYQPDFDLENLEVVPNLILSGSNELRLPLRWTAILYGRISADIAVTTGIHNHEDVLKSMMAGAKAAMVASELLKNGVERIREITADLARWMEDHEYESIAQMQGSMSQIHVADPSAFERANYMKTLQSWMPDPTGVLR